MQLSAGVLFCANTGRSVIISSVSFTLSAISAPLFPGDPCLNLKNLASTFTIDLNLSSSFNPFMYLHEHTHTHTKHTIFQTALSRNFKKKGSFSPEEDQIILKIVRNWDTDDATDHKHVSGPGLKSNQFPTLEDSLAEAIGYGNSNGRGSDSSSGSGSVDEANDTNRLSLFCSSDCSTTEVLDHSRSSLTYWNNSSDGANDGSGAGIGDRGGVMSAGSVKKSKVPRKGKWVVVGDALNRPPDCCSQRYRDTLIKRPYAPS